MQLYNSICVIIIKQIKTQHKKNVDVNSKLCLINELLKYNTYMYTIDYFIWNDKY